MEATALSIGKSVLDGALGYAKSALAEEVALQLGVRRDQVFITNELEMMHAFLMTAHDERYDDDRVVKVWVKQVRDVAYDVEDTLQEFAVRLEKQSWWRIRRTLLDRRRVAKQMKELRANVEDVSQRNMRYHLIKGSSSKTATTDGKPAVAGTTLSGTDEARWQRDRAKFDLIRMINKTDIDLRVISVWGKGIGDLGETSIIKRVYEDPQIHKKFECRAWVTGLRRPFNSTEFLKSVVEQFYINFLQEEGKEEKAALGTQVLKMMGMMKKIYFAHEFKKFLKERSYFIVLNDILTIEEWDRIKACFPDNKKGSLILVSTEQIGVASLCVGAENGAPEHKQLFADQTLHVFYKKGSQDGKDLTEAGCSSQVNTASSDSSAGRKMFNRTETMLAAFKESRLIGRENEKSDILKLIANDNSRQREVICLWGMGGIGKTTIIRDIYQSEELAGNFDKRACITIMRPFNPQELLKNLAMQMECKDVEDLVKKLEVKKYLIVLDDLLSTTEWDALIPSFPATETSSRIIVTTRIKDIAKHCSKNSEHEKIYELKSLGQNDARDLFIEKVFDRTTNFYEQYPELVELANLILKKCKGLPLAIVTIGGFLANQPKTAVEWRKLNEHISAELEMNPELGTIRTILMRSYDGLPYHLKSCFLYLPIFPEDYRIGRGRLARRWSAEGYSREVHGRSAEEIAGSYFMELISRSMILPSQQSIRSTKGIDACQVHDLMREISMSKSLEENLVFTLEQGCSVNTQGIARHLAINGNWEGDKTEFESTVDMSRVRSVTVFGKWKSFFISDKMSLLRVLDLEDTTGLYDHHIKHIGNLLHLSYLSLRGCDDILHLPDSLGDLRQLETLDIRDTQVMMLPNTIIKLRKLQYLRAGGNSTNENVSYEEGVLEEIPHIMRNRLCLLPQCLLFSYLLSKDRDDLKIHDRCTMICCAILPAFAMCLDLYGVLVPRRMRKLKALRTLGVVNIGRRGKDVVQDIEGLTQLCKLGVTGVNKESGQELCSAVVGLRRLESLSIRSEGKPGLCDCLEGKFSFSETLQSLKLYGNLVKLPEWIQGLKNLVKLKLRSSRITEHDAAIQVLGNLPNLAFLHLLEKSLEGEEVRLNFQQGTFLSLVVLELSMGLEERLKSVKFEHGAARKLEVLKFGTPIYSGVLSGLRYLASLKEVLLKDYYTDYELACLRAELTEDPRRPIVKRV
ncbi:hypothetical protein CFC21_009843 [Triticum aestivum]|uniref:Disease resistance protein RPM1 n=3 Tax=Triticum aestivum TaxID=4565 RepID=A0A3B5ZMN1_WHEAT|nr:hypothetical protein CFC21_009843 [Triticum aestivum]